MPRNFFFLDWNILIVDFIKYFPLKSYVSLVFLLFSQSHHILRPVPNGLLHWAGIFGESVQGYVYHGKLVKILFKLKQLLTG